MEHGDGAAQGDMQNRAPDMARRASNFAGVLNTLADHPNLEMRVSADLYDVADKALAAMHQQSQEHRASLPGLVRGMDAADRRQNMDWLMQAFQSVQFSDGVLFQAATILDRYYAALLHRDATVPEAQRTLLAAVFMAVKMDTRDNYQISLQQVVEYLSRGQVSFHSVIQAETVMLPHLSFCISTPTAYDFVEVLSFRIKHFHQHLFVLAGYLLQLTLSEASVHWGHPHAVLAASVLALAALTLEAPAEAVMIILEDLRVIIPRLEDGESEDLALILAGACEDVHNLWVLGTNQPTSAVGLFASHLRAKFTNLQLAAVTLIQPPVRPPVVVPAHEAPAAAWAAAAEPQPQRSAGAAPPAGGRGSGGGVGQAPAAAWAAAAEPQPQRSAGGRGSGGGGGQVPVSLRAAAPESQPQRRPRGAAAVEAPREAPRGSVGSAGGSREAPLGGYTEEQENLCSDCGRQFMTEEFRPHRGGICSRDACRRCERAARELPKGATRNARPGSAGSSRRPFGDISNTVEGVTDVLAKLNCG